MVGYFFPAPLEKSQFFLVDRRKYLKTPDGKKYYLRKFYSDFPTYRKRDRNSKIGELYAVKAGKHEISFSFPPIPLSFNTIEIDNGNEGTHYYWKNVDVSNKIIIDDYFKHVEYFNRQRKYKNGTNTFFDDIASATDDLIKWAEENPDKVEAIKEVYQTSKKAYKAYEDVNEKYDKYQNVRYGFNASATWSKDWSKSDSGKTVKYKNITCDCSSTTNYYLYKKEQDGVIKYYVHDGKDNYLKYFGRGDSGYDNGWRFLKDKCGNWCN